MEAMARSGAAAINKEDGMSTITVVRKDGWVAIAADALTKAGSQKVSAAYIANHEKIVKIGDSYVAITGEPAFSLVLRDYFTTTENEVCFDNADAVFRTWLALHPILKERYFLNPEEDRSEPDEFESSQLDVLIANSRGIFGVTPLRWVEEFPRFYAKGRGDEYALGAMYAVYDDRRLSAEEIARRGVEAAAEFDDGTGLPVTSYAVKLETD
jgi:ATP-dependent HslUV protease, peptidase subunit HslV